MRHAKYVRLYTDEAGESRFEDLKVELVPVNFAPPAAPLDIAQFAQTAQSFWMGAPVGWAGDTPHPSPRRQILCLLQGECEVTGSDGDNRRFSPGSILVLSGH